MATAQTSTSQDDFPAELNQVPLSDRVPEAFGWLPFLIGGTLLCLAVFLLTATSPPGTGSDTGFYGIIAGTAVAGILLLYYEFRRRPNRTVLVPRNDAIGIYRKRRFAGVISPDEVIHYKLSWWNTFWFVSIPLLLTACALIGPIMWTAQGDRNTVDKLGVFALGLLFLTFTASMIRTRLMCVHFYIPRGRRQEEVMFPRSEARRVVNPIA